MIKAIIFDCFGVLTADSWKEFIQTLTDPDVVSEAHRLNHAYDSRQISLDGFLGAVAEITGVPRNKVELTINKEGAKNAPLLAEVKQLKSNGYKTAILSNVGSDWITSTFLTEQEQALFDDIIVSYKVGVVKPHYRIYKVAAEQLGVATDECIFVDDSASNCDGARVVGMQAILYENLSSFKKQLQEILE